MCYAHPHARTRPQRRPPARAAAGESLLLEPMLAPLGQPPVPATVDLRAVTDCVCLVLTKADLELALQAHPASSARARSRSRARDAPRTREGP